MKRGFEWAAWKCDVGLLLLHIKVCCCLEGQVGKDRVEELRPCRLSSSFERWDRNKILATVEGKGFDRFAIQMHPCKYRTNTISHVYW